MVTKVEMNKSNSLGYGDMEGDLLGRRFGFDIYNEQEEKTYREIWVYDRSKTKRFCGINSKMVTRNRIVACIELSKERSAWHVDLINFAVQY